MTLLKPALAPMLKELSRNIGALNQSTLKKSDVTVLKTGTLKMKK